MSDTIKNGVVATIAYKLTVDGQVVEEAPRDDALDYLHGFENIVPGLELALEGKAVGDKVSVTLAPEDAYGEYDDEATDVIDRSDLPEGIEVGMELLLEDEEGYMMEALVKTIHEGSVVLDFNSPLAGKTVTFDVEVIAIRQADEEELEHGHAHGMLDDLDEFDEYEFDGDEA